MWEGSKAECRCMRDKAGCPRHFPDHYRGRHCKHRPKHRRRFKVDDPTRDRGTLAKCDCGGLRVFVCPKHTPDQYPTFATHKRERVL